MFPPLGRLKAVILLIITFGLLYISIPYVLFRPPESELNYPKYGLKQLSNLRVNPYNGVPLTSVADLPGSENFIFVPSLFPTSNILNDFLSNDGYYAKVLSEQLQKHVNLTADGTSFTCICGRISDACVCCGTLASCNADHVDGLPSRFCTPLILFPADSNVPTRFCVNVTYIPKKEQIRTSGFLMPQYVTPDTNVPLKQPLISNQTLVLFDDQYLPSTSPPLFCVENSKTYPELSICINFTKLRYLYDSESDHKTAFIGCGQVSLLSKRRFWLARYQNFCFRAHRGAAGDVDQAVAPFLLPESLENRVSLDLPLVQKSTTIENRIVATGHLNGSRSTSDNNLAAPVPLDAKDMLAGVP
ncbi:hypothetical protein EG68_02690 [Paragonimus skrjabini miyazakii]|uniref:DUF4773 domain-containing protein n=1 Tax=Paragonimus skrjabini miyazakii TaxID=59628 RepID=A0A8S9Z3P6_9TREM|nr:hypothetical protein EG68_02690 [Paragonimus skrjabini miyazakii]